MARRSLGIKKTTAGKDGNISDIETNLQQILGTRVRITHGKKRGHIRIEYYSTEDLNRILGLIQTGRAGLSS